MTGKPGQASVPPLPIDNPLVPEQMKACWFEERDKCSEAIKVAKSLGIGSEEYVRAHKAHADAREKFYLAEQEFLHKQDEDSSALAKQAAEQLRIIDSAHGEISREQLSQALDVFERFAAARYAHSSAVLGSLCDRIFKMRPGQFAGGDDWVINLIQICAGINMLLLPVQGSEQQVQDWEEWKANADDWESFMDDTKGGSNAREWLEATLPAITLLKQFLPGWSKRVETDVHEWVTAVTKDVTARLNNVHDKVAAIAKHGGTRDELERSFDEISKDVQYFQTALGECEDAVVALTRRRPLR